MQRKEFRQCAENCGKLTLCATPCAAALGALWVATELLHSMANSCSLLGLSVTSVKVMSPT